jgi:hypothetical protein
MIEAGAHRGNDDDDKLVEKLIRENLSYLFGSMVGLREFGSSHPGLRRLRRAGGREVLRARSAS